MSLDDVWKWEVTWFHEYWQLMDSKLSEQKTEKHEMLNCGGELKADENWMSAQTS